MDQNLSLRNITFKTVPRLERLRDRHFWATEPEICTELPANITRYMKYLDDPMDSPELRAGKLYRYVMENKQPVIADDNLLAGTTTTKPLGVLLYPDLYPLCIWPELETISTRKKNPFKISDEDIALLNFEVFPFWIDRTVMEVSRKTYGNPECQRLMERLIFYMVSKPETISHTIPNYGVVLERGLRALIEDAENRARFLGNSQEDKARKDFYKAVQLALSGIITYARRLSQEALELAAQEQNPEWRHQLEEMSEVCRRVPAETPRTFREALNAIWICKIALHQENANLALSLGRLDQILYPFYAKDINSHRLTMDQAAELVGCFWLKIADHVPMIPEAGEELVGGSGSNQAITLGGVDLKGQDAVNDLTYLMLRVTELLALRDPNVNARYCPGVNSDAYLNRLCEVNIETKATPCFHNDVAVIDTLMSQGVTQEHARDYGVVGCVEPTSAGRTYGHTGCILLNLTAALEMALMGGKHRLTEDDQIGPRTRPAEKMASFSEFKETLETQLGWLIDLSVTLNNFFGHTHQQIHPTPMLSAMMEGCMEKGLDVIQGGATYNSSGATIIGLAETVDSVTALEELVFIQKKISMQEMIEAIKADWQGDEKYKKFQLWAKNSSEKFGTDSKLAAANANWLMDFMHQQFQSRENYRGGRYTVGYWTMTNHAGFGRLTGALPSGRNKGEPFASGITPVSGASGVLTPCLNFVAGLDHRKITNGQALNLKYTPADQATLLPLFAHTIKAYFGNGGLKTGGLQVQFNIMSRETLIDAVYHPQKREYKDLLVRVSGYTAYFIDLNPQMQEEIINRAEYDLGTELEKKYKPFRHPDLAGS
jgi:pyruvate formate-lyase/glycerol dehydratase family glycyl radical enzyme